MKYSPFMRGVMRFEDYNYNLYNQFILLDQQVGNKMQNTGYANMSRMGSQFGESLDARLTQHNLDKSIQEDHVFDVIGEMNDDERLLMQNTGAEENVEPPKPQAKNDDGQDDSQEEHEGDNSDGEEY